MMTFLIQDMHSYMVMGVNLTRVDHHPYLGVVLLVSQESIMELTHKEHLWEV